MADPAESGLDTIDYADPNAKAKLYLALRQKGHSPRAIDAAFARMGIDDKIAEARRNKQLEAYKQAVNNGDGLNRDLAIAQLATIDPKFAAALMTMTPNAKNEYQAQQRKEAAQDAMNKAITLQNMRQAQSEAAYDRRQAITRQQKLNERAAIADAMAKYGGWSQEDAYLYALTGFDPAKVSKTNGTQQSNTSKTVERQTQNLMDQLIPMIDNPSETPEYIESLGNSLDVLEDYIRKHQFEYSPEQLDELWTLHKYGNFVRDTTANKIDPSQGGQVNVPIDGKESNATRYYRDLMGK